MFVNIEYHGENPFAVKEEHKIRWLIIDDELGNMYETSLDLKSLHQGRLAAIIRAYEYRKLPVVPNIVAFFRWMNRGFRYAYSNLENIPEYQPYKEEVEKVLALL